MSANVKPIPDGYHTLTPYLIVNDGNKAIEFYTKALGAQELMRIAMPNGKVGHAEMKIGDSIFMLSDEEPDWGMRSPTTLGGNGSSLMVYLPNVDEATKRATDAGAKIVRPLENKFYGDRAATIEDPFGHQWTLATHVEDVPPDEIERRAAAEIAKMTANAGA